MSSGLAGLYSIQCCLFLYQFYLPSFKRAISCLLFGNVYDIITKSLTLALCFKILKENITKSRLKVWPLYKEWKEQNMLYLLLSSLS